jgi:predicted amidophosphoribosyltransferase
VVAEPELAPVTQKAFCTACGEGMDVEDAFCSACGEKVKA